MLIIIIMLLMGLTFLVGLFIFTLGHFKKEKNKRHRKAGLIIAGIPTGIVVAFFLLSLFGEIFTIKPNNEDLVGKYHIVKVTQLDFDKSTYGNYKLQFYKNGTFTLTPTPYIEVCESGKYQVDYKWDYNELSLKCSEYYTSAHIDRGFGNFQIEFIIGDPDSGESIYFERIKN